MIFRQITASGDWTFGKGKAGYATDEDAIELNIITRLRSWKGDCFFALGDFVDWLSRLDKGQEANLLAEIKSVILQSYGVFSVESISGFLDRSTRNYVLTATINTIFGTVFLNSLNLAAGLEGS